MESELTNKNMKLTFNLTLELKVKQHRVRNRVNSAKKLDKSLSFISSIQIDKVERKKLIKKS